MKFLTTTAVATFVFGGFAFSAPPADDLLSGPTIEEETVTNEEMVTRKLQESGKTNKLQSQKTQKTWMLALDSVGLSEEQKGNVKLLVIELKNAQKEFHTLHGKEVAKLRTDARAARKEGSALSDISRTRLLELMEFAPDIVEHQDKVWKLLSIDQQKVFQLKFQELLEKEEMLRAERKKKDSPLADEAKIDEPRPKKPNLKDDDRVIGSGKKTDRKDSSVNDAQLRSIKFLRRLQKLQNDS